MRYTFQCSVIWSELFRSEICKNANEYSRDINKIMRKFSYVLPTHVQGRQDHICWCKVGSNLFSCTSNSSSCTYATIQSPCILVFCHIAQRTGWRFIARHIFHSKTVALQLYTSWRDVSSMILIDNWLLTMGPRYSIMYISTLLKNFDLVTIISPST